MTWVLTASLLLSAAPPFDTSGASRSAADAPRAAATNWSAASTPELRHRWRVLLDGRPTVGRFVGAGLMMSTGIALGVVGALVSSALGGSLVLVLISAVAVPAALVAGGIALVVTGVTRRAEIDAEAREIEAELRSRQQGAVGTPYVERTRSHRAGLVLAQF